jgi:mercuric ion transport protein
MSDRSPSLAAESPGNRRAGSGLDERTKKTIFAGGGVLGAVAMSSCCIVPLVLFSLGVTGAWIGNLAALYPYKPYFFVATAGFLGAGFYRAYRKPKASACAADGYCATTLSDRINKAVLWGATVLVVAALAFPYVAPVLLDS